MKTLSFLFNFLPAVNSENLAQNHFYFAGGGVVSMNQFQFTAGFPFNLTLFKVKTQSHILELVRFTHANLFKFSKN